VNREPGIPIRILLDGLEGDITVDGVRYKNLMPGLRHRLTDEQIAGVLTYVRLSWGNVGEGVSPAVVAEVRAATPPRRDPWTAAELETLFAPVPSHPGPPFLAPARDGREPDPVGLHADPPVGDRVADGGQGLLHPGGHAEQGLQVPPQGRLHLLPGGNVEAGELPGPVQEPRVAPARQKERRPPADDAHRAAHGDGRHRGILPGDLLRATVGAGPAGA
jgi:hypothetical protein